MLLGFAALSCAAATATETEDGMPSVVGPEDEVMLRPATLASTECYAKIERPFPADLTLKLGTLLTLRTSGPICPPGVTQKLAYRFYVEKVDINGMVIAPRVSPQGTTAWSLTKSEFDTSNLTAGRYRIYMYSMPRTMIEAWQNFDPVARNRSTWSGNAYVHLTSDAVNLRTAAKYVVLAKSGISTVPSSVITGNMGVSPAAGTAITGFDLIADATNLFSTSAQVTGRIHAPTDAAPTPTNVGTAILDMQTAFSEAAARAPTVTELGAGDIGGMTLPAGVYKFGTGLLIPTSLTLTGKASDVFIFQIAQDLTIASGVQIILSGGARPENVFWQVSGLADVATTAHVEGIVLSQTSIALHTGASINGRLLAQTAITLDGSTVTQPALQP